MRIHPASHRVLGSRPRRQHDPNGPHKDQGSGRMATTEKSYGRSLVPRVYRVLSLLHPQLFESSTPLVGPNKKGNPLGVDSGSDNSIRNIEETNVLKTRPNSTPIR